MRFVVVGLGAVGGAVAASLCSAGFEVVGVARGSHGSAIQAGGLRISTPDSTENVRFPVFGDPAEVDFRADDAVLLAVKSQDTESVVASLRGRVRGPVVALQNGVANEPRLARAFPEVYGVVVMTPAMHLAPGEVAVFSAPQRGKLDIGRFPFGSDAACVAMAEAFTAAGFESRVLDDVMRWKYAKLIVNLPNAAEALAGRSVRTGELGRMLQEEGRMVLSRAAIPYASAEEDAARRGDDLVSRPIDGVVRAGGSTWQSLARGGGSEVDYLNGEIVLLGLTHGVPTPANSTLVRLAARAFAERREPGTLDEAWVLAQIAEAAV